MIRFLGRLGHLALLLLVLAASGWTLIELVSRPAPPPLSSDEGWGFRAERGTQHLIRLDGDPYALGYHNARLLGDYMTAQEERLFELLFAFAKGPARAMFVRQLSLLYIAGIDDYLSLEERQEIRGLAEGKRDPYPDTGPRYARITAYHAIHELSQRFAIDNPFQPPVACSLVAVGGERGLDGHAFLGRNFDFEGGDIFDLDKVVLAVTPKGRFGFVSVSWSGMAGVLSGMNEKGLAIVINAGASSDYRRVGAPITLLARRALERASTIEEAVAILTSSPTFVADAIGLSEASGRVAVLEITPEKWSVREGPILFATNHFESPGLRDDPVSTDRFAHGTTGVRRERLEASAPKTPIGETELLAMLRDRRAKDGKELPLGHRHAIDALIATHSVIFDSTAGKVWVSEGPHTLGAYHGYDVKELLAAKTRADLKKAYLDDLPADPLLPKAALYREARIAHEKARTALAAGDLTAAESWLARTAPLADHPITLELKADFAKARGNPAEAAMLYRAALATPMEYPAEAERVKAKLER